MRSSVEIKSIDDSADYLRSLISQQQKLNDTDIFEVKSEIADEKTLLVPAKTTIETEIKYALDLLLRFYQGVGSSSDWFEAAFCSGGLKAMVESMQKANDAVMVVAKSVYLLASHDLVPENLKLKHAICLGILVHISSLPSDERTQALQSIKNHGDTQLNQFFWRKSTLSFFSSKKFELPKYWKKEIDRLLLSGESISMPILQLDDNGEILLSPPPVPTEKIVRLKQM